MPQRIHVYKQPAVCQRSRHRRPRRWGSQHVAQQCARPQLLASLGRVVLLQTLPGQSLWVGGHEAHDQRRRRGSSRNIVPQVLWMLCQVATKGMNVVRPCRWFICR